jgi:hypothetical protein
MMSVSQVFTLSNVSKGVVKSSLLSISKVKTLLPLNLPRVNKNYLFDLLDSHLIHYASPITLTYAWSFGALAGICLVIQMISGIFLAMHYTPHIDLAFSSVEYIMRDGAGCSIFMCFYYFAQRALYEFFKLYLESPLRVGNRLIVLMTGFTLAIRNSGVVITSTRNGINSYVNPAVADFTFNFRAL